MSGQNAEVLMLKQVVCIVTIVNGRVNYDRYEFVFLSFFLSFFLSNLKEEALDRIKWRNCFGRGCGPVV